jgi:NAD(P)-dependent dehydrogenase (short-subunit alcohol dehydrogenase family)
MGKDFALRLISEGYIVYGAARRIDRMQDIEAAGGQALAMDVTDDATMVAGVEQIIREHGRMDVLINNAGYGRAHRRPQTSAFLWCGGCRSPMPSWFLPTRGNATKGCVERKSDTTAKTGPARDTYSYLADRPTGPIVLRRRAA